MSKLRAAAITPRLLSAALLTCSALTCGQQKEVQPPIDLDQTFTPYSYPTPHNCTEAAYELVFRPETKALIHKQGFESDSLWSLCSQVDLPWLPTARILRIRALVTDHTDDNRELTLIQASPKSRLWVVPIINGMVGYLRNEQNIHNIAAFNDLLSIGNHKVTDKNVEEISDLYQWIVGMQVAVPTEPGASTLRGILSRSDTEGMIGHRGGNLDYTHRERNGDSWSREYMVWQFRYSTEGDSSRLLDVDRKSLNQYNHSH